MTPRFDYEPTPPKTTWEAVLLAASIVSVLLVALAALVLL